MKRFICIIITVCILMVLCVAPCFASSANESEQLTQENASSVLKEALDLYSHLCISFLSWYAEEYNDEKNKIEFEGDTLQLVKDGYGLTEVSDRIKRVFSNRLAEQLNTSGSFIKHYREVDGKWYFKGGYAAQAPILRPTEDEISACEVVSCVDGRAVVQFHTALEPIGSPENRETTGIVKVFLVLEDGTWRVNGADLSNLFFHAATDVDTSGELTDAVIKNAILALAYDLYFYAKIHTHTLKVYSFVDCIVTAQNGIRLYAMPAGLQKKEAWISYGELFADSSLVAKLMNSPLLQEQNGKMMYMEYCNPNMSVGKTFSNYNIANDSFTVQMADSGDEATVTYRLPYYVYQNGHAEEKLQDMKFVFNKTENGWRVTGGNFYNVLNELYQDDAFPPTGDENMTSVQILTLFILCLLFMLACVQRQKKYCRM